VATPNAADAKQERRDLLLANLATIVAELEAALAAHTANHPEEVAHHIHDVRVTAADTGGPLS